MITLTVRDPDGYVVVEKTQKNNRPAGEPVTIPFTVDAPRLWSPAAPNLYTVTARVACDSLSDEVTVRTGFRRIAASGRGLLVNGDTVRLHGVALYHDRASVANAFTAADYDEDLAFVHDVGANAVHSVSGPHDQYLYDRLDERGLMAWIDLPLMRSPYLGDVFYFPTERFRTNGREQLREIVAQNFNHPSVVMWGIFSLVWQRGDDVTPYIRELHTALKRVDPSRPTVALSNQDGELNTITDLIALKQNVGWMRGTTDDVGYWCETLHKSWGNLLAAPCYGVPGYPSQQDDLLGRPTPGTHWLPERWQTRFHEEYARRIVSDPGLLGRVGQRDVRFRYGARRQRPLRLRYGDTRPPAEEGHLLPLPYLVEPARADALHRRAAVARASVGRAADQGLFVGRRSRAAGQRRQRGAHEIRRGAVPCRLQAAAGREPHRSALRRAARQRVAQSRHCFKSAGL